MHDTNWIVVILCGFDGEDSVPLAQFHEVEIQQRVNEARGNSPVTSFCKYLRPDRARPALAGARGSSQLMVSVRSNFFVPFIFLLLVINHLIGSHVSHQVRLPSAHHHTRNATPTGG